MDDIYTDIYAARKNLVLKLAALGKNYTRKDISRLTTFDKNTINAIVNELIDDGVLCEFEQSMTAGSVQRGRKAACLGISPNAPLIGGMLIKRGLLSVVIGRLDGTIAAHLDCPYSQISERELPDILCSMFETLCSGFSQRIAAVGISSIGPIDLGSQTISPAYFFNITNLPISRLITERLNIPAFLINDVNAGALAEKLWGGGKFLSDFIYIHIMNGIGAGLVLNGKLYNGSGGKSGELGHTSINVYGPQCECGSRGCLDLYTTMENINQKIQSLQQDLHISTCLPAVRYPETQCSWSELIDACGASDTVALCTLDEFCSFLSVAIVNMLNLLDIDDIIIGYENAGSNSVLEDLLSSRLNLKTPTNKDVRITKSRFADKAPLYGSFALICDMIFTGKLSIF